MAELAFGNDEFTAAGRLEPTPELRLSGVAEAETIAPLSALLEQLHQRLVGARATSILVDVRLLEFLNASCLNVFVRWLTMIKDSPRPQRYLVRFATNSELPWQRRTLRMLSQVAPDVVLLVP